MNLNLSFHRSGVILPPNLLPERIRIGDILTHRHTHRKVVVSCIQEHHLLLVDAEAVFRKYEPKRRSIGIVGASTMFIAIKTLP